MININKYIVEKLHLGKNKVTDLFDPDEYFVVFHKLINDGKNCIYIENIVKIQSVDEENSRIVIKPIDWNEDEDGAEFSYIIYGNHILLCKDIDEIDKGILLPRKEAIEVIQSFSRTNYVFDVEKYFEHTEFGHKNEDYEVRKDCQSHKLTEKERKDIIIDLLKLK